MFMDICNPSENSCFSKIFPVLLKCDFSWFQPIIGRFYKMRVSWELTFTTFLSPLLTRCYRFLTRCEYYLWLDSKYNVRRCDVLVQNKTIHSLNLFIWSNISLKMATWAIGKTFMWYEGAWFALSFLSFQSGLTDLPCVLFDDLCQILGMFLISIWLRNKSAVLLAFWREIQPTDVCKTNDAQIFMKDLK